MADPRQACFPELNDRWCTNVNIISILPNLFFFVPPLRNDNANQPCLGDVSSSLICSYTGSCTAINAKHKNRVFLHVTLQSIET